MFMEDTTGDKQKGVSVFVNTFGLIFSDLPSLANFLRVLNSTLSKLRVLEYVQFS
jgi:hypothetical protein